MYLKQLCHHIWRLPQQYAKNYRKYAKTMSRIFDNNGDWTNY